MRRWVTHLHAPALHRLDIESVLGHEQPEGKPDERGECPLECGSLVHVVAAGLAEGPPLRPEGAESLHPEGHKVVGERPMQTSIQLRRYEFLSEDARLRQADDRTGGLPSAST